MPVRSCFFLLASFSATLGLHFWCAGSALAGPPEAAQLAKRVDDRIGNRWVADKVTPAEQADDATFVRRVYLDLIGRIPTAAEARSFLDDKSNDKRVTLVDRLLDSAAYARHWATVWRRHWIPQADQPETALADGTEGWLADRLREGTGYDRIVRELLTASPARAGKDRRTPPPAFLVASEFKPEGLAASTARAFLGVNLDCAQCHDHPFARWTRDQFWQTAAFFTRPTGDGAMRVQLEISPPGGKAPVRPRLLTGEEPNWPTPMAGDTGRVVLAEWVTAKNNPYFARNAVNRVWAQLLGTGLIEPLDDLSEDNSASHPEVLTDLSKAFVEGGFDLRTLIKTVVLTRAYQLSSVVVKGGSSDPRLFAVALVRGLSGEQLYDSLRTAVGVAADRDDLDPVSARRDRVNAAVLFRVDRPASAQRSIPQALALMNGRLTVTATSPAVTAVAEAPFLDATAKVEALYLAAFARKPSASELARLVRHVDAATDDKARTAALADVFWVLLNSAEFQTNH